MEAFVDFRLLLKSQKLTRFGFSGATSKDYSQLNIMKLEIDAESQNEWKDTLKP